MHYFILSISILVIANSQSNDYAKRMEVAISFQDTASNYFSVEAAAKTFEAISSDYPNEWLAAYWASHSLHQIGIFQTRLDRIKTEAKRLDKSLAMHQRAWDNKPNESADVLADLYANQSLLYSFYARLQPLIENFDKIGYYWELVGETLDKGIKANPNNPRVKLLIATTFAGKAMKNQELDKLVISNVLFKDLVKSFAEFKQAGKLSPT